MRINKTKALFTACIVVGTVLLSAVGFSIKTHADVLSPYTATLRYYDDIQITYTLNYPSGSIWSGSGDVPIGGVAIADQIYCADPFVAFHSIANTSWDNLTHATVDTMGDYVVAAPWATSTTVQQNDDALRWLIYHAYRGDYLANDNVSVASVARLNAMYPSIGPVAIDRRIALMATKVAIWKQIEGDNLIILRTSLNANEQITFDNLVAALVSDAQTKGATDRYGTEFSIDIHGSFQIDHDDGTYDYYGPLTIAADLWNSDGGAIELLMNDVFLTASGPDSDLIEFVDAIDNSLPNAVVYGTAQSTAYLNHDDFSTVSGEWTSTSFYLKIPKARQPQNGEHLTIRAMAKADDVPLVEGTTVLFIHGNSGIQDWNYVQAFIGAAKDGMEVDLYAEARLRTSDLGAIRISKSIEHASPFDENSEFEFKLYHSDSPGPPNLINDVVILQDYIISSALDVDYLNNTITLKNGGSVIIDGLPQTGYYWVEELQPLGAVFGIPRIDVLVANGAPLPTVFGFITNAFVMDDDYAFVRFTNTKDDLKAHLSIAKVALDYFADGREPAMILNTSYTFILESSDDNGATWMPVNLSGIFKSDSATLVDAPNGRFSLQSLQSAFIEIDPSKMYRIIENNPGADYVPMYGLVCVEDSGGGVWNTTESSAVGFDWNTGATYTTEGIDVIPGGYYWFGVSNIRATTCDLSISKTLVGNPDDIDTERLFSFEVFYMDSNYGITPPWALPLSTIPSNDKALIEGITEDRIVLDSSGNPVIFMLKHNETATVKDLPAGRYMIREVPSTWFSVSYAIGSGSETLAQNGGDTETFILTSDTTVAFTNTLTPRTPPGTDRPPGGTPPGGVPPGGTTPRTGENLLPWGLVAFFFIAAAVLIAESFQRDKDPKKDSRTLMSGNQNEKTQWTQDLGRKSS